MRNFYKSTVFYILVFIAIMLVFSWIQLDTKQPKEADITGLISAIDAEQIKTIEVRDSQLDLIMADDSKQVLQKEPTESLSALLKNYNVNPDKMKKVTVVIKNDTGWKFWASILLPIVIPVLFVVAFFWFMMRQAQGSNNKAMSFGQSGARQFNPDKKNQTTFKDVAGVKEAKQELEEVVEIAIKKISGEENVGEIRKEHVILVGILILIVISIIIFLVVSFLRKRINSNILLLDLFKCTISVFSFKIIFWE